jgi:hypothetical protein
MDSILPQRYPRGLGGAGVEYHKREFENRTENFSLLVAGLFVMVFIGITKFTGIEAGGEGLAGFLSSIPNVVLAVLGIAGVDLSSFGGYYAIYPSTPLS